VEALGQTCASQFFNPFGCLSLMIIGGLVLTKHIVAQRNGAGPPEVRLVSNVSHELRTPSGL
jgi:hypothetical protein